MDRTLPNALWYFAVAHFMKNEKKGALFINEQIPAVRIQTQSTIRLSAVAHFPHMILLYSGGRRFAGKSTHLFHLYIGCSVRSPVAPKQSVCGYRHYEGERISLL